MTVYAVFIREGTKDPEELKRYADKVGAAREGHDLTALVKYGPFEVLEGAPIEGAVILQFPDMEAARRWYHSPEYQAALPHRLKGGDYRVVLLEGLA